MLVIDYEKLESTRLSNNFEILTGISGIGKESGKNLRANVDAAMHPKRRDVDQTTRAHFGCFHSPLQILQQQNAMAG
jgi:hypothetical protein